MDPKDAILQRPGKFHLFVYAGANPIGNVDPSGQDFDMATLGAGIAGANVLAAMAGTVRMVLNQDVSLSEIGQTASSDLKLIASRILVVPAIGMERDILNKAEQIIDQNQSSNADDAFGRIFQERNSSYEKSQDLALAAAEHYFFAKATVMNDPYWLGVLKLGGVFGYDTVKAIMTPLAIGTGRYAISYDSRYPTTPPTVASLLCGTWGILEGAKEAQTR